MELLFLGLFCVAFLVIVALLIPTGALAQTRKPEIRHYIEYTDPIEYGQNGPYGWEDFYNKTTPDDIEKYRKEVAPLSPERFIRRIKMLFGVDITGHIDDMGHFYFSELVAIFPQSQLVRIQEYDSGGTERNVPQEASYIPEKKIYTLHIDSENNGNGDEEEIMSFEPCIREFPFSDIELYCKWIYYSDKDAYTQLRKIDAQAPRYEETEGFGKRLNQITNKHLGAARFDVRDRAQDHGPYYPFPGDDRNGLYPPLDRDVRFIQHQNTAGRIRVENNIAETNFYNLDFDVMPIIVEAYNEECTGKNSDGERVRPVLSYRPNAEETNYVVKPTVDSLRYTPPIMGFLGINIYLTVPNYVSLMGASVRDFLREHKSEFEKYDYFGYTLLRQLARTGKVDNSQIGVPHTARALNATSLRLDPQQSSIVFDSLQNDELFTVFEMGYDKYYLAQCAKPVEEWNKRDENGYAMCTGRLERVWGYVPKKEVVLLSEGQSPIRPFVDWGIVSDADGYTNLRDKDDTRKVIEQLPSGEWVKILSYDMNYYLVETPTGTTGRIHKSRIIW